MPKAMGVRWGLSFVHVRVEGAVQPPAWSSRLQRHIGVIVIFKSLETDQELLQMEQCIDEALRQSSTLRLRVEAKYRKTENQRNTPSIRKIKECGYFGL